MSLITTEAFKQALREEGVRFEEHTYDGVPWYKHKRPASTGTWDPHYVAWHHTGKFSSIQQMVDLLWHGRSDLPGPLSQGGLDPVGLLHLIGWGRANHMGLIDAQFLKLSLADALPLNALYKPGADVVDGNANGYGIEVFHPGDNSAYPVRQIDALVRTTAAIDRAHRWTAGSDGHHKEGTRRKVDMSATAGDYRLRQKVAERLQHPPSWLPVVAPTPTPVPTPAPIPAPLPVLQGVVNTKHAGGQNVAMFRGTSIVNLKVGFRAAGFSAAPAVTVTSHSRDVGVADWNATSAECVISLFTYSGQPHTGDIGFSWQASGR